MAKKLTKADREIHASALIKKKVKEAKQEIDLEALTEKITADVTKRLVGEFEGKVQVALQQIKIATSDRKDEISLVGGDVGYSVVADTYGLGFKRLDDTVLQISRVGTLSTGTKSPRTVGKGSVHFKAGEPSEADIPTSGDGSTRGLIVEGDGDDEKTFVFKAASRMNRQGTNIHSDGSLTLGAMQKVNNATLGVSHRQSDMPGISIIAKSKAFEDNSLLQLETAATQSTNWNAITVNAEAGIDDISKTEVFRVDGEGSTFSARSYFSNKVGYAEFFEWADGNHKDEDRTGFTVALNSNGKLIIADEGDLVIGVVVKNAAVVGNERLYWKSKFYTDKFNEEAKSQYNIVEWLENETTELESYFKTSLDPKMALPENAIEFQTDAEGNDLYRSMPNGIVFEEGREYKNRNDRQEWAVVCLLGTTPVYKGQLTNPNWIVLKNINDELELTLIR
jgi:hypothetical protein|tara:strand:+ start:7973 stop:9325 length:1353 start_codon:yes stop_codon:yes gene_type:complete